MTPPSPAWALLAAALAAGAAGCDPARYPPPPVDRVDYVVVSVQPIPMNWDDRPGPDGLEIELYLFRPSQGSLPVTVSGAMEFALYEGRPAAGDIDTARPLRTWRFAGDDLRACLARSTAGWGYAMRLAWGPDPPKTSAITLTARYVPPEGRGPPVSASPTVIAIGPR